MGDLSRTRLPTEFPIFPLAGAMLLPGGRLPLNIFEPRYVSMVDDALGAGRILGMIQPDVTKRPAPTGPSLYRIGCLGRIDSFTETEDGRYLITLAGLSRFAVTVELEAMNGYRRVRADVARFARDRAPVSDDPAGIDRIALLRALRTYFTIRGFDANWQAIEEMPEASLVTTLCMVCAFEPAEKQVLLEAADTVERGRTLLTLLEMGAHQAEEDSAERKLS